MKFRMRDQGSELGWRTVGEFLIDSFTRKKINAEIFDKLKSETLMPHSGEVYS